VLVVAAAHAVTSAAADSPTRAFRVPSTALSSSVTIRRAVSSAVAGGFDTVVAPVAIGPRNGSEPLDGEVELLRLARESGLRVHLSLAVNVAAGVDELPASREHVIYQHPEWLMVPRQLAAEMLAVDVRSPGYLGRIARWTRANADRVSGIYVSPLDPDAASYLVGAIAAAVARHTPDGVYLESVDFPGTDFDYSRHAMGVFRTHTRAVLPPAEREHLDAVEAIDPFAYAEEFPDQWREFRESALTRLLDRLRATLTVSHPSLLVTVGAASDPDGSVRDHFQDWRAWLERGIVDRIGYPSRSSGIVLFSADGAIPPDPVPATSARGAADGEPR